MKAEQSPACLASVAYLACDIPVDDTTVAMAPLVAWSVFLGISVVQNVSLSALIVLRIWRCDKEHANREIGSTAVSLVVHATLESGGLLSVTILVYMISLWSAYLSSTIMLDIVSRGCFNLSTSADRSNSLIVSSSALSIQRLVICSNTAL